jgi:hypothetical protein
MAATLKVTHKAIGVEVRRGTYDIVVDGSHHIKRVRSELLEGKRRPCCWLGCTHRKDKELSPSVRWVLSRRSKASA